jgi:hypothetical protein
MDKGGIIAGWDVCADLSREKKKGGKRDVVLLNIDKAYMMNKVKKAARG